MAEILQWLTEAQDTLHELGNKCECLDGQERCSCPVCHAQRLMELAKMKLKGM